MHSNDALPPIVPGESMPPYFPPEPEAMAVDPTSPQEATVDPTPPPEPPRPSDGYLVTAFPSGNPPEDLERVKQLGWNWGGFFLPYFWLIGHGRLTLGFLLTLSALLPFVGFAHLLLYPATALYLGVNGYELAWREQPYHSVLQLRERERPWMFWGAALSIVFFVMLLLSLFYLRFVETQLDRFIQEL